MIPPRPDLGPVTGPLGPDAAPALGYAKVTWPWWEALVVILGGFFIGSIVAAPLAAILEPTAESGASGPAEIAILLVVNVVLLGVIVLWFSRRHPTWLHALGLSVRGTKGKEIAIGAGLGLAIRFAAVILAGIAVQILVSTTGDEVEVATQVVQPRSLGTTILFVIQLVIVAPIVEEMAFRGLLYRSIRDRYGIVAGVAISSMLFGLVHFVGGEPWQNVVALQITMIGTGVGLALIYEWRKNLIVPIAGHMAFNLFSVVFILAGWG